jgi:hypothetical protein
VILGRGCTTYCCPTPPDTSSAANCQTKETSGTVPTYPTNCSTSDAAP